MEGTSLGDATLGDNNLGTITTKAEHVVYCCPTGGIKRSHTSGRSSCSPWIACRRGVHVCFGPQCFGGGLGRDREVHAIGVVRLRIRDRYESPVERRAVGCRI